MKKSLLTILALVLVVWVYTLHLMGADGSVNTISGTTTIGGSAITGTALTNFQTGQITFTNNAAAAGRTFLVTNGTVYLGTNWTAANVSGGIYGSNAFAVDIPGTPVAFTISTNGLAWCTLAFQALGGVTSSGNIQAVNASMIVDTASRTFGHSLTVGANFSGSAAGSTLVNTNLISRGLNTATNGFASFASDAGVAITATGLTNALGKNATAYVTATAVAFTIKDAANTTLYTSPSLTATISVQLHPGWSVNAASGLSGTLLPE